MAVRNLRRIINLLVGDDVFLSVLFLGLLQTFLKGIVLLSHGHVAMNDNIVLTKIRVKRLCSFRQGLLHGGHNRVLLVFHLQKTKSLVTGHFIFRNDAGNIISVNPDSLIQKLSVTDILVGFLYRPGVSCCGELDIRHIKAGKNLYDSRYLLRLTGINALYQTISDGGMVNLTVQNILRL